MAYIHGEKINRAIGVFVSDLAKLSPRIQMMWKGFELENQEDCRINSGFVENLIEGLTNNKYDLDVYEKQKELMEDTYEAVRAIRMLFMGHPMAKNVEIPKYLLEGKNIVFY